MSKVRRTVRWFRDMSVLAEDEQRRSGHPEIEVEHLFLALLSIGGPVTEALAEGGVALASAREAFANVHARHLVALGVEVPTPSKTARRIPASKARVASSIARVCALCSKTPPISPSRTLRFSGRCSPSPPVTSERCCANSMWTPTSSSYRWVHRRIAPQSRMAARAIAGSCPLLPRTSGPSCPTRIDGWSGTGSSSIA